MRRKKQAKTPRYMKAIIDCADCILTGTLLAIDPSTGSKSSMPGFAVFQKGELIESGIIKVDLKGNRAQKLYQINHTLRTDFGAPDVVAVESAGYFISKMNPASIISLQRAIGAVIAAWPVKCLVEVPSNVWQRYVPANYVKGDEMDAVAIGMCVIYKAREALKNG